MFVLGEMDMDKRIALQNFVSGQGGMIYNYVSKRVRSPHIAVEHSSPTLQVTHYIATDEDIKKNSMKAQSALAKHIPLVSGAFIDACVKVGHAVVEGPYLMVRLCIAIALVRVVDSTIIGTAAN